MPDDVTGLFMVGILFGAPLVVATAAVLLIVGQTCPSPHLTATPVAPKNRVHECGAMTSRISHTTVDCMDAYALSEWWKEVLDYTDVPGDPNEPEHEECMILDPHTNHRVLFIEVPQPTPGKNLVHFDLRPTDRTQDEEVDRLLAHGATLHADLRGKYGPGTGWVTLADPAGNLFCVLKSDGEIAARSDG